MHSRSSRLFQYSTLIVLASLCWLLNQLTQFKIFPVKLAKNKPEYSALGANIKVYTPSGILKYQLRAESMVQYPNESRIYISNLNLILYQDGVDKYTLSANNAWFNMMLKIAYLGKNTHLISTNKDPQQIIVMDGSAVNLNLVESNINSEAMIKIQQNQDVVTAIGFNYDLRRQFLILKSKVNVFYHKKTL